MRFAPFAAAIALLVTAPLFAADETPARADASTQSVSAKPTELSMLGAGSSYLDLRFLPGTPPLKNLFPVRQPPDPPIVALDHAPPLSMPDTPRPITRAPAPAPSANFIGLDFQNWGSGIIPDVVGDVGPTHFIQAVNSSIGIFRKSDGVRLAAFTFDTFMSQGTFGNLCDTDNVGSAVVLYDTFEDRWVISDSAYLLDANGNVVPGPGAFRCIAVSRTSDPLAGGWNFYSIHLTDGWQLRPYLSIWPDGIYMSANFVPFNGSGSVPRAWALNKAQMYANAPTVQVLQFDSDTFWPSLLPANARVQTGTPPLGAPNYFGALLRVSNALVIFKFDVDWTRTSLSTYTGPFEAPTGSSWANSPTGAPIPNGNSLSTSGLRLMMQNQYSNIGGVESIWLTHTVGSGGVSAPRYYQANVTGGNLTVAQTATFAPDTTYRFAPSLAVDRAGNMMLGYSAASSTLPVAIRYAGRLSTDPINTLPQTESTLIQSTGNQQVTGEWTTRASMSLDPNGCDFWLTHHYYIANGPDWQTRIGSFTFPAPTCTPLTAGTVSGVVTAASGGAPIIGANVALGARSATTNASGVYNFSNIPDGTYPEISASRPGFITS